MKTFFNNEVVSSPECFWRKEHRIQNKEIASSEKMKTLKCKYDDHQVMMLHALCICYMCVIIDKTD